MKDNKKNLKEKISNKFLGKNKMKLVASLAPFVLDMKV